MQKITLTEDKFERLMEIISQETNEFKISDYWNLSLLNQQQLDQLNTDLSVFIFGNDYGDNIQIQDGEIQLTENAEKKTLPINIVKQELQEKYGLKDWQIVEQKGANEIKLVILFSTLSNNEKILIAEMQKLGWSASFITPPSKVHNVIVKAISFEPLYFDSIKDSVISKWTRLLHVSPAYNFKSIQTNGLIPLSQNSRFSYPPRIHLLKPTIPEEELYRIIKQLYHSNKNPQNNFYYDLYAVDLNRIPDNVDFFYDPRYQFGVCTEQPIPPSALIIKGRYQIK